MSDSEKIKLINQMIADFWEFHEGETITKGAETFVTAIYSVLEFDGTNQ